MKFTAREFTQNTDAWDILNEPYFPGPGDLMYNLFQKVYEPLWGNDKVVN